MENPTFCPYCGNERLTYITDWNAKSNDPTDTENEATVDEYICDDCGLSFWI